MIEKITLSYQNTLLFSITLFLSSQLFSQTTPQIFSAVDNFTIITELDNSTLAVENEIFSTFYIYPNLSSKGEVNIKMLNEINEFTVSVSNLLRQQLLTQQFSSVYNNIHTINTTHLKQGIYAVSLKTDSDKATKNETFLISSNKYN